MNDYQNFKRVFWDFTLFSICFFELFELLLTCFGYSDGSEGRWHLRHMVFQGHRPQAALDLRPHCQAVSSPGISWTNLPGSGTDRAVIDWGFTASFDETTVIWPAAVKTDEGFIMWYRGASEAQQFGVWDAPLRLMEWAGQKSLVAEPMAPVLTGFIWCRWSRESSSTNVLRYLRPGQQRWSATCFFRKSCFYRRSDCFETIVF